MEEDTVASFFFPMPENPASPKKRTEDKEREDKGEDIGFWGCFLELSC